MNSNHKIYRLNTNLFFYTLSAVVALVGLNVRFGVTLYLSRITIGVFLILLLVKLLLRGPSARLKINKAAGFYGALLLLIIIQHLMSVSLSLRIGDGLRQIFIYLSLITLFVLIHSINLTPTEIIKGLKVYLAVGFFQGCYGIYQVIGGPIGLPMYQNFIFWPTAGDKTVDGVLYSGVLGLFRATGFLPGDVSHYAAYLSTVIILAISFLAINPRSIYLKLGLIISFIALLLSFSRSGLLSLVIFGLPALFFVNIKFKLIHKKNYLKLIQIISIVCAFLIFSGYTLSNAVGYEITTFFESLSRRYNDLVNIGVDRQGSASIHIYSRLLALDAFSDSPFMGVGLGVNASPWMSETYGAGWAGSHSHHFDILGQTGLIGAIMEWVFMLSVCSYMWLGLKIKQAPFEERILLASLLSISILIIFGNLLYHYFLNDFVWYLLATGCALCRAMQKNTNKVIID